MRILFVLSLVFAVGCASPEKQTERKENPETADMKVDPKTDAVSDGTNPQSDAEAPDALGVVNVDASGTDQNFSFAVQMKTADTGCAEYADWWEVVDENGSTLLYRRILAHSHVDEQPFTRSGGPIAISSNDTVVVRGHRNTDGYLPLAYKGSVANGFEPFVTPAEFGAALAMIEPLPGTCAF